MNEQQVAGSTDERPVCEGCRCEIDPDCCGCGDLIDGHSIYSGHSPVPMGCQCGREPPTQVTDLCEDCNERPITGFDARCDVCRENANERAYDRSMEEPTYRGGEYASAFAEEQARIQRELK